MICSCWRRAGELAPPTWSLVSTELLSQSLSVLNIMCWVKQTGWDSFEAPKLCLVFEKASTCCTASFAHHYFEVIWSESVDLNFISFSLYIYISPWYICIHRADTCILYIHISVDIYECISNVSITCRYRVLSVFIWHYSSACTTILTCTCKVPSFMCNILLYTAIMQTLLITVRVWMLIWRHVFTGECVDICHGWLFWFS